MLGFRRLFLVTLVCVHAEDTPSQCGGDTNSCSMEEELDESSLLSMRGKSSAVPSSRVPRMVLLLNASEASAASDISIPDIMPATNKSAMQVLGVAWNDDGDISVFTASLYTNIIMVIVCLAFFMWARKHYPYMYSNNVKEGIAPLVPNDEERFGWARAVFASDTNIVAEKIGLDGAMLLEFSNLCVKISATIGLPIFCILGPVHYAFGGEHADPLSSLSIHSVKDGSPLFWVHVVVVWTVVILVRNMLFQAQEKFLEKRYAWLRAMPQTRATTLLVEGIPSAYQSDAKLESYFQEMFGKEQIKSAHVVKKVGELSDLVVKNKDAKVKLAEAHALWKQKGEQAADRPQMHFFGKGYVDSIEYLQQDIAATTAQIAKDRSQLNASAAQGVGGVNTGNGFVTFTTRNASEVALSVELTSDTSEWVTSIPPPPSSILWLDLQQDPTGAGARMFIGYGLIVLLYIGYMPLCLGISRIATDINLGPLQPLWAGFAPTLGLQFMIAFLPTFIKLIFQEFFILKDDAWSQARLQVYYFWFQVVFVLLVPAVGPSVLQFTKNLIVDPFSIFGLLADAMPFSTHWYMSFMMLQWSTHAKNLTRYFMLTKYFGFRTIYEPKESAAMAEPEDQDYYGLGSRTSRWTINMIIGLMLCTICPPILILTVINFGITRLVYGYLVAFAETRKPDLGGVCWVKQLEHLFFGLGMYCVLMIGVLYRRAATQLPAFFVAPALIYVVWSYNRFATAFAWKQLPFQELVRGCAADANPGGDTYIQPEFLDER